jgi:folate-binding protein YgfZ
MPTFFDPGPWVQLRFTGPDRRKFLHGLVTADVLAMPPGGSAYSCLLTPKGRLRGDFDLYDRGEELLALASPLAGANIMADLGKPLMLSETRMEDVSARGLWYTDESLAGVLPAPRIAPRGGWLLTRPSGNIESPERFMDYLTERGVPLFGRDMDEQTLVQEARLDAALSFTKGCYMGQETVSRIHHMGHVNRLLCRLKLSGEGSPPTGALLFAGEEEVGCLTSVFGNSAMGWVKAAHAVHGDRLTLRSASTCWTVEVF